MQRRGGVIAVTVLMTAGVLAQSAPNLTGTWTIDREKTAALSPAPSGAGGSMGGGGGSAVAGGISGGGAPAPWIITQTAAALTIVRAMPDGTQQKFVYKLDGSESVNVNGRSTQKTKSVVAGGKITTTGSQTVATDQGDITSQLKEVRSLDKDGAMIVEMTRTVEGSGSRTTIQAFKKAS